MRPHINDPSTILDRQAADIAVEATITNLVSCQCSMLREINEEGILRKPRFRSPIIDRQRWTWASGMMIKSGICGWNKRKGIGSRRRARLQRQFRDKETKDEGYTCSDK
jgi:hypothetical protein